MANRHFRLSPPAVRATVSRPPSNAWRIATRFMTPVIILSDGYIANGSEPWKTPECFQVAQNRDFPSPGQWERRTVPALFPRRKTGSAVGDSRYARINAPGRRSGKTGRHWKCQLRSGKSPTMVNTRAKKVALVAEEIEPVVVDGPDFGNAGAQLGWNLRGLPHRGPSLSGGRTASRTRPPTLAQPISQEIWATC